MPLRFIALNRDGKNVTYSPHFRIFLNKNTVCIFYKCKHIKFPFLVYFGSPCTALSNTYRTVFIYYNVLSIFLNWKVIPIFALKW